MKKILWLTSWYPNKTDMFTGDFIQRHAKAAALYNKIIVLHVAKAEKPFFDGNVFEEINSDGNLIEHIVYYQCNIAWRPFNKIISFIKYIRLFRKLILIYLKDEISLAHVHVPLKAGLLAIWLKMRYKIRYALTEHYVIYNRVIDNPFHKRSLFFKYFTKKIIKESTAFVPVSNYIGNAINSIVITKPFSVIFNTVNTSLFYLTQNDHKKFKFIHVSTMASFKNTEGLIRSFARAWPINKNIELVLVGPYNNVIYKLAEGTGLLNNAIFFSGEVTYDEVAIQMQQAKSLILFSRIENMPCVILEALCCGLPVIATNVGGIPEVVNASNGILVQSEDENGLKEAIIKMIAQYDEFDREEISKNAIAKFSYDVIGKEISELYKQIAS